MSITLLRATRIRTNVRSVAIRGTEQPRV